MTVPSDKALWAAIATMTVAMAAGAYSLLSVSSRLDALEVRLTERPAASKPTDEAQNLQEAILAIDRARRTTAVPDSLSNQTPDALLPPAKRGTSPDLAAAAASHARAFTSQPSIPAMERQNSAWLQAATNKLPEEAPVYTNLQTTCRGHRCIINADFADAGEARMWATLYLLAKGGGSLKQAATIIQPIGPGPEATLQLHLY